MAAPQLPPVQDSHDAAARHPVSGDDGAGPRHEETNAHEVGLNQVCSELLVDFFAIVPHPRGTPLVGDGERRLHQMQSVDDVVLGPLLGGNILLFLMVCVCERY